MNRVKLQDIDDLAHELHLAPAAALRDALREHADASNRSKDRLLAILGYEIHRLQTTCVDVAAALFELAGARGVADDVRDGAGELCDMLDAARVSTRICVGCGCTEFNACPGGCSWVGRDLCSRCHGRAKGKDTRRRRRS